MIIEEFVVIHTSLEKTWDTFADLTCWKKWNSVISDVSADTEILAAHTTLRCNFRPFFFRIRLNIAVEKVIPYSHIVWSSAKKGLSAHHDFFFRNHEKGVTVTSRESFTGLLVKGSGILLPISKMRSLTKIFLRELKKAAEA